ncbi:MAG: kelch repeat-containing protein [Candidatus Eisenbacteria bacterium]
MMRRVSRALCALVLLLTATATASHAAAVRWTNAAGGNWSVTTNWSSGALPTAADTAVFDTPGTYTVTINSTTVTIAGLRISGAASGVQTVTAASGRTLTFNGPVVVGAQGVLTLGGATVNGTGGYTVDGTLNSTNQALPNALTLNGTFAVTGASTQNGTFTMNSGSTLRISGVSALNGQLTVANGFTNNGAIELTSSGAATAATLAVTNGTLVNAAGATISSLAGSGGGRNLSAKLDNQGTITVAQALTTNKASVAHTNAGTINLTSGDYTIVISGTTPSFTTTGTINVPAGRTITFQGGVTGGAAQNFNYNGGTMGGAGTVALLNAQLNLNVALASDVAILSGTTSTLAGPLAYTVTSGTTVNMNNCDVNGTVNVDNGGTFTLVNCGGSGTINTNGLVEYTGANTLTGATPLVTSGGSLLRLKGIAGLNATLTCTNGFTNNGTIELTSSGAATAATLAVTNGTLVNAASASIQSLVGSLGGRNLNAKLDNQGTITVAQTMTTNKASAALVNSGTIDLTSGDYTILISGTGHSFTTTGTINVPAGRTMTFQGGVTGGLNQPFNYNGGTMGGAGTIALLNSQLNVNVALASDMAKLDGTTSTLAGPQAYTVKTGTAVNMNNCDFNGTVNVDNGGTLTLLNCGGSGTINTNGLVEYTGANTLTGLTPLLTSGGSMLRLKGIAGLNASLTCTNGFTNNGTIELTSSGAATAASLTVTNGTLTNVAGAAIQSLPGSGGGRNLNAKLDNQGTITVAQTMTTNKASVAHVNPGTINLTTGDYTIIISGTGHSFTTTGTINVPAGRTLTLQGGVTGGAAQPFNYNGGTMGGAGTVALLNSQLNLNVALASDMALLDGTTSTLAGPQTYTVKTGTTVNMNNCSINGTVNVDNGGSFTLLNCDGSGTINTNGLVEYTGANTLTGATPFLTSGGSVLRLKGIVGVNASLTCTNGFTNNGTIELTSSGAATAASLTVTNGTLTNVAGAAIQSLAGSGGGRNLNAKLDNQGTITVAQTMTTNKGSVAHVNPGTINLTSGDYTIIISGVAPSFTTTGTINVPTGRKLTLQGGVAGGAAQNFNYNSGTMGGAGTVALLNSQLNLNQPLHTTATHLTGTNSTLAGPDTLFADAGTTTLTGCNVTGPVVATTGSILNENCDWANAFFLHGGATVEWRGTNTTIGYYMAPGSISRVIGTVGVNASLTFGGSQGNAGLLELTSSGAATAATVTISAPGQGFFNGPTGEIRSSVGSGGIRQFFSYLDNQGLADFQASTSLNRASVAHRNRGTVQVASGKILTVTGASFTNDTTGVLTGGGTITMNGATTFAQRGTIRPGGPQGTLTLNGACPNTATAVYDIEIGGDDAVTGYDRLAVRDAATIAGTLHISLANGYVPKPGVRYVIVDAASRTGTFSSVTGLSYGPGQLWAVAYSDTDVVLIAQDQTWTRVFPDGAPPAARDGHTAVYDSTGDRMIVFGGRTNSGVQNDVWVLTHAKGGNYPAWVPLSPTGTPPVARTNASAVYDAANNRMIVYGGDDGASTTFVDAWVLTNANGTGGTPAWLALSPGGAPAARSAHGAAYDAANNLMIVFGGTTSPAACGGALADVWTLANANGLGGAPAWTALAPTGTAPSARAFAGVAYDAATHRLLVTGGDDGCGVANAESFVLDDGNGIGAPAWSMLAPASAPTAGWSRARFAYDPSLDRVDAFGGVIGGAYTDTSWTLTSASSGASPDWFRRNFYGTRPTARAQHSMVMATNGHVAIAFGGLSANGRLNDVWRRATDLGPLLDVEPAPVALPTRTAFALPPSPNPARGEVSFAVDVARAQRVDVGVFDVAGRRVATLNDGVLAAGRHTFRWNGTSAAPGVYMVRMHADDRTQTHRIVRVK